jgi:oligopeptide transport system substrate-binding protein
VPRHSDDIRLEGTIADAKRLMAEAGYPDGKGFPDFTLTISDDSESTLFAEAAQAMWKNALGVEIKIQTLEKASYSSFYQQVAKSLPYGAFLGGGTADTPDPWLYYNYMIGTDGLGYYPTHWQDTHYNELLM